ncbi:polyprenyl synthetase family protein [Sphingobacterium alkalisoli]|uniref:Polyprenyl synthetase family protein n=1 Tax=Sphingobacterium alkalisoli TaxID=1874115 RepID=A0A4U0GYS5_9SPHI|nr:polyprenyl synthetase family protein [Sphingobacterium alkalisoli]TJY64246.1 polyprenyl synthetase family protein [Sphingobacterium alkalisoli]GGH22931.1 isoprenyl synthetase [Sphingobacterium alkalisoli]
MFGNTLYAEKIQYALEQASFPSTPDNLYDPIRYMLSLSGKRIRPLLVLLGADLFNINNINDALPASLAIEYFHNFSLIHDDIMDNAPLRRGQVVVHKKWNENIAILSGDALLVKAYEQLASAKAEYIPELLRIFNKLALEVCEGQQYDMDFERIDSVTEDQYIEMIRLKTSVLLGGALEMGAVIADAIPSDRTHICNFGVNLGIAFQLQDDILDIYGDPSTFGKQIGGDIIANKKTILYILLKPKLVEIDDIQEFEKLLTDKDVESDEKVRRMKNLYQKYHVVEEASRLKEKYTHLAYKSLEKIGVNESQKKELYSLADNLMRRTQ